MVKRNIWEISGKSLFFSDKKLKNLSAKTEHFCEAVIHIRAITNTEYIHWLNQGIFQNYKNT